MRLIDADALAEKKFQERECNGLGEGPAYRQGWNDAIDAVMDNEPSAQPEQRWISVKFRPITDEEQKQYPDYCYITDCQMPYDEQEILVTVKSSKGNLYVEKDVCYIDDGFFLDSGYDWQTDIIAWMPLPEPYTESEE